MYKVFLGEKCILFSERADEGSKKGLKAISFRTVEELHTEYKKFVFSSNAGNLIVVGKEEKTWTAFLSLFSFIKAAGGLVVNKKGEWLLIYRNRYWDLPKGKTEPGESSRQTALREVEEECGVSNLKIIRPLISTYHIFSKKKKDCIKRTDWFEMSYNGSAKLTPQKEEGIIEAKWMNKREVKKKLNLVYPSLREVILCVG